MGLAAAFTALLKPGKGKKVARIEVLPHAEYTGAELVTDAITVASGFATFYVRPTITDPLRENNGTQMLVVDTERQAPGSAAWETGGRSIVDDRPGSSELPYGIPVPAGGKARLRIQVFGAVAMSVDGEDGDTAP